MNHFTITVPYPSWTAKALIAIVIFMLGYSFGDTSQEPVVVHTTTESAPPITAVTP